MICVIKLARVIGVRMCSTTVANHFPSRDLNLVICKMKGLESCKIHSSSSTPFVKELCVCRRERKFTYIKRERNPVLPASDCVWLCEERKQA